MPTKTVLETLEAARMRIAIPENWCQRALCVPAGLAPWDAEAEKLCALGAIIAASGNYDYEDCRSALLSAIRCEDLSRFNDSHTHAEVLAAFDAAIAKEKEAQHDR